MLKSNWPIVFFLSLALHATGVSAQADGSDKVVTLTVSGQGSTPDAARQSALRNAIEQAFGTFISSHTEILNDQLVKDEIVSVANGNIQAFDVLSEVEIPGGGYASTLKATVSINRLTSFVESKGVAVEFKGALFAMNIKQQLLNEESEFKAMTELADVMKQISDKSFDYFIAASEPTANGQVWNVPLTVTVKPNANLKLIPEHMSKVLAGLSMNGDEVDNYRKLNKPWFSVVIRSGESSYDVYALRNERSINALSGAIGYFVHSLENFEIDDGLTKRSFAKLDSASDYVTSDFRGSWVGRTYIVGVSDAFRPVLMHSSGSMDAASLLRSDKGRRGVVSYAVAMEPEIREAKRVVRYDIESNASKPRALSDFELIPMPALYRSYKLELSDFKNAYYHPEKDVFPSYKGFATTWGQTGIALQFQVLIDDLGAAATFTLVDWKTLDELQRVSGYTIRACEVATPLKSNATMPVPDETSKFSAPTNAAQPVKPSGVADERIYDLKDANDQPTFPGGMEAMYTFLNKSMKYPEMEYEAGIQGTVHVQFTVAKDGSIVDAKVLRTVSEGLDREALRVVKGMPKWNPGTIDGKPVKCRFNLPLVFKLKTP